MRSVSSKDVIGEWTAGVEKEKVGEGEVGKGVEGKGEASGEAAELEKLEEVVGEKEGEGGEVKGQVEGLP